MNAVIIFDITPPDHLPKIIQMLRAKGYFTTWSTEKAGVKEKYILPHNVVWQPNKESIDARNEIQNVVTEYNHNNTLNVKLSRCIILNSTPWNGILGEEI